ncbi:hypothetical protein COCVIDRAFT_102399, partial [Bipolaris victoriae FI3]
QGIPIPPCDTSSDVRDRFWVAHDTACQPRAGIHIGFTKKLHRFSQPVALQLSPLSTMTQPLCPTRS